MKSAIYIYITLFIIFVIPVIYGCSEKASHPAAKHVIIIGLDGVSHEGVLNAHTPTLDYLMENGSYSLHARCAMPSSSGANWGSMLMGAGPEQHGITFNDWSVDYFVLHPTVVRDENHFPTIFAVIREQLPDAETGSIPDWNPINRYIEEDTPSYKAYPSDQYETTRMTVDYIKEKHPLFTFVQIDHVDGAGHSYGWGSEGYYRAVASADSMVAEIIQSTKDAGIYDETVFIVSSDHGGIGYGHGGETPEEIEIPVFVYGKNVKNNHRMDFPINIYDIPATGVFALGLDLPFEWIARPLKSAFVGNADPQLMFHLNNLIPSPGIYPEGEGGYNAPGGLFINEVPVMELINQSERGEIRYTLDGSTPNSNSILYEGPVEISENSVVTARVFEDGRAISAVNTAYFRIVNMIEGHGLRYTIYEKDEMRYLPDFSTLEPTGSGIVYEVTSNTLNLTRPEFVAAVLEGYIDISQNGSYTFFLSSDDGSKLYINGEELINNDGDHGVITKTGRIDLDAGLHDIRVEWFNAGGGYWLSGMIEGPDLPRQIIPPDMLYLNR